MYCTCSSKSDAPGLLHWQDCMRFKKICPDEKIRKEAKHFDDDKIGLHYILAMTGLQEVAKVGDFGAKKYGQFNYKAGMPWMRLLGSCARHLIAFIRGEDLDNESKLPHLAHLCYDALMLLDYQINEKGIDDRFKD